MLFSHTADWLKTTANGGHVANSNGYDILFFSSDGSEQLDHEIELYNGTIGQLIAWVRIPTLDYDDDTVIKMCYGNSAISTSQENVSGVWDSNYQQVLHLKESDTISDTGFLNPSATGDDYTDFTNPSNAYSSDDSYAVSTAVNEVQDWYNFNISIPDDTSVSGIQVDVEAHKSGGGTGEIITEISYNGGTNYTSKNEVKYYSLTSDVTQSTGDSTDQWGLIGWNANDLTNANFRVRITNNSNTDMYIDHVRVKVYYRDVCMDSTANDAHGWPYELTQTQGKVGYCQEFLGAYLSVIYDWIMNYYVDVTKGTISAWIKLDPMSDNGVVFRTGVDADNLIKLNWADGEGLFKYSYKANGTLTEVTTSSISDTDGLDHYVAITWDTTADEVKAFLNGSQIGGTQNGLGTWVGSIAHSALGFNFYNPPGSYFNGLIDEFRISDSVRSPGWIQTEHANQNSPSTFYTLGSELGTISGTSSTTTTTTMTTTTTSSSTTTTTTYDLGGYLYYRDITIDNTKVSGSSNHSNFPLLFSHSADWLKTTGNGGLITDSNGYDIIFTSPGGSVQYDHEIEQYDGDTGLLIAWIRIPILDYNDDTTFRIYYCNSGISTSQQNKTGVWDSDYIGVWHLHETSGTHYDSTQYGNNTTTVDVVTQGGTTAKIGRADQFNGTDDNLTISPSASLNTINYMTLESWVRTSDLSHVAQYFFVFNRVSADKFGWSYRDSTDGFSIFNNIDGGGVNHYSGVVPTVNTWHHLVLTCDGTYWNMFIDNDKHSFEDSKTINDLGDDFTVIIANVIEETYGWEGYLDEIRISRIIRSDSWVATEYANQNSPSTFYSIGSGIGIASGTSSTTTTTLSSTTTTTTTPPP